VRPSSEIVQDFARSGTGLKLRSSRISMLKTLLAMIFSTKFELVVPLSVPGSPVMPITIESP
jgi:hypothetical protein